MKNKIIMRVFIIVLLNIVIFVTSTKKKGYLETIYDQLGKEDFCKIL